MAEIISSLFEALVDMIADRLTLWPETTSALDIVFAIAGVSLVAIGIASACGWI